MEATAQGAGGGAPPQFKRRFRNFLIDPRFQLLWVFFVVLVITLIIAVMGYIVYDTVANSAQQLTVAQMANPEFLDQASIAAFEEDEARVKLRTILWISGAWLVLAVFLAGVTIVLTHKISGPAFKMKRLLGNIDGDHLQLWERLRKGDELQHTFTAFDEMVRRLRESRHQDIEVLEQVRAQLDDPASQAAAAQALDELIGRFKRSVEMK